MLFILYKYREWKDNNLERRVHQEYQDHLEHLDNLAILENTGNQGKEDTVVNQDTNGHGGHKVILLCKLNHYFGFLLLYKTRES